ncbi:hypothetical protein ACHQM5_013725 [Ranunculus cassubicifolius]
MPSMEDNNNNKFYLQKSNPEEEQMADSSSSVKFKPTILVVDVPQQVSPSEELTSISVAASNTPRSEFFDAPEDAFELLSSESVAQISSPHEVETDIEIREEIERRKKAEDTREILQKHWERLAQKLSQEGLTLPAAPSITEEDPDSDPAVDLCKQISYARNVSTCIGREAAKAEAGLELESRIQSKDSEIARLRQRLLYHETINHEMVLRNQEAVEMTRGPRKRSKRRKRWIWSTTGVTMMVGSLAIAWHFYSNSSGSFPADGLPEGEAAAKHESS